MENRGIMDVNNIVDKVDKYPGKHKCKRNAVDKYVQKIHTEYESNQRFCVDNVDKLSSKEGFADFNDISGPHGYQQIAVYTIFQQKFLNLLKRWEIIRIGSLCFEAV